MTRLTPMSEDTSLVLVTELIAVLEQDRLARGQSSLVALLKAAVARARTRNPDAAPRLQSGLADAARVLEWVEQDVSPATQEELHFDDLSVIGRRPERG